MFFSGMRNHYTALQLKVKEHAISLSLSHSKKGSKCRIVISCRHVPNEIYAVINLQVSKFYPNCELTFFISDIYEV
jgi:hypothetical protein